MGKQNPDRSQSGSSSERNSESVIPGTSIDDLSDHRGTGDQDQRRSEESGVHHIQTSRNAWITDVEPVKNFEINFNRGEGAKPPLPWFILDLLP